MRPTRPSCDVLRLARTILEEFDALIATARSVHNSETGPLSVGFCTSVSADNLQASLLEFKERLPQIALATVERSRTRLAAALRNGALDLVIVTGSLPFLDTKAMSLWSKRVLVALPHDHPLIRTRLSTDRPARQRWCCSATTDPGKELEYVLVSKLVSPEARPKIERVSRGIIKSLISMNTGISLVHESDIGPNLADLVYRELRDGVGASRFEFSACWRADNENPALQEFLKLLSEGYSSPSIGR